MTMEMPERLNADSDQAARGAESRAKAILGLNDIEQVPRALPIRVERMWRARNFAPHIAYTGSILFPMGPAPDIALWRDSIAAVVLRHEALRSRLAVAGGRAIQIVDDQAIPGLDVVNASRADIETHYDGRRTPVTEFLGTPFNLLEDTGLRCRAFRDEDGNVTMAVLMHHYFGDAWSSQILRREIETVQTALAQGKTPDLPPAAQYCDYALSQRRSLAKNLPSHLAYWRQRLENVPPPTLPFDRGEGTERFGRLVFSLPPEVMAKLTAASQADRISIPMICLSAFQLTLARWCGQEGVMTAVTTADRLKLQFRGTIGRLMAGIPLYSRISEDMRLREFLASLAKEFYGAVAHQDLSFEQYDEIFSPPRPFCNIRFNFIPSQEGFFLGNPGASLPAPTGVLELSGVKASTERDLYLLLMQYPEGLVGRIIYSFNFSPGKVAAFVAAFRKTLDDIGDNPDARLSALV